MSDATVETATRNERSALIAGIAAFGTWGLVPVYWKFLKTVPATEILAHRFVWTTLFLIALLTWQGRWPELRAAVRNRRSVLYCVASGSLIAINWFFFIWSVVIGRVLETSLGYFMTPLVNIVLGAIFLRERLTRLQFTSVILAAAAVLNLTIGYGRFPWVALTLCFTFGSYGLLRKKSGTAAIPGLFLETTLLAPFAIVYLVVIRSHGALNLSGDIGKSVLLLASGIVTGLPLVWFGHAARYLRLTTVGFLQYLAPTGSFFLGVFLYHEQFTRAHLFTFVLIWIALALFTWDAVARWGTRRRSAAAAADATGGPASLTVR